MMHQGPPQMHQQNQPPMPYRYGMPPSLPNQPPQSSNLPTPTSRPTTFNPNDFSSNMSSSSIASSHPTSYPTPSSTPANTFTPPQQINSPPGGSQQVI